MTSPVVCICPVQCLQDTRTVAQTYRYRYRYRSCVLQVQNVRVTFRNKNNRLQNITASFDLCGAGEG
jgi:hypothetical protein